MIMAALRILTSRCLRLLHITRYVKRRWCKSFNGVQ